MSSPPCDDATTLIDTSGKRPPADADDFISVNNARIEEPSTTAGPSNLWSDYNITTGRLLIKAQSESSCVQAKTWQSAVVVTDR